MRNPWTNCTAMPRIPAAVLGALHLSDPDTSLLGEFAEREWREAIEFAHRSTVGLDLARAARAAMPEWVRLELDGCAARNRERIRRACRIYSEIQTRFQAEGLPWAALKGVTHSALFGENADERQQYDIDIYVPPERALEARDIFLEWGYEPLRSMEAVSTDHLPAMVRKTGWEWRGDYFDVDAPFVTEIHVQFWNEKLERLAAPGVEGFWDRREQRAAAGLELPMLAPPDALGYAALHLLKHVLQGSTRPYHALEIARFLEAHAGEDAFWRAWRDLHPPGLRRLETVGFRFAQCWFGCEMPEAAGPLPAAVESWFEQFAASPLARPFRPNKDELWLHLTLIDSRWDRWRVARRRLLPMQMPGPVSEVCVPRSQMTPRRRLLQQSRLAIFAAGRLRHHALALPRVVESGARWWLGKPFWTYLAAAALFNFALFAFMLLYNLFLLDLGFKEDFIGTVGSASTIGTMLGTLPAGWVLRRCGIRWTLIGTISAGALVVAMRAVARAPAALIAFSAAWGMLFAVWAVIIAPAIAALVPEERRPAAFSTFFASMIAVGIGGNWVGGRLPQMLHNTEAALLLAAGLALTALIPAWRLRPAASSGPEAGRMWPRGPFLKRYLAGYAVWQFAIGAFNPFANVYFARLGFSAARIGSVFSALQVTQVAAILLAPALIRRAGLLRGIVWMMAATGLGLFGLAPGTAPVLAYAWYMGLQCMSEPGINTLLMNNVKEHERSGASSLNYLVAFAAQAAAAFAAGHLFASFGYRPVLAGAGAIALAAAALFRLLM